MSTATLERLSLMSTFILIPLLSLGYPLFVAFHEYCLSRAHALPQLDLVAEFGEGHLYGRNRHYYVERVDVSEVRHAEDFPFEVVLPAREGYANFVTEIFYEISSVNSFGHEYACRGKGRVFRSEQLKPEGFHRRPCGPRETVVPREHVLKALFLNHEEGFP